MRERKEAARQGRARQDEAPQREKKVSRARASSAAAAFRAPRTGSAKAAASRRRETNSARARVPRLCRSSTDAGLLLCSACAVRCALTEQPRSKSHRAAHPCARAHAAPQPRTPVPLSGCADDEGRGRRGRFEISAARARRSASGSATALRGRAWPMRVLGGALRRATRTCTRLSARRAPSTAFLTPHTPRSRSPSMSLKVPR